MLTGQGDHFCSGGDLGGVKREVTVEEYREIELKLHKLVRAIPQMEKPVIAMVKGYSIGGGMSLALACDIIFAAEDTEFTSNFIRIGLIPEMGVQCFLPMAIGLYRAKELWFSAKVIDAHEAYRLGIANRIFPKEKLEEEILAFAREVAGMPPISIGITKQILNATFLQGLDNILNSEIQGIVMCGQTKEFKERVAAFQEKRIRHFLGEEK